MDEHDRDLFRRAVGDVAPLEHDRDTSQRRRPRPEPLQSRRDEAAVRNELLQHRPDQLDVESGEDMAWHHPGVGRRTLRRLRRGRYSIGDELDLHSMNEAAARTALREFIAASRQANIGCVRVIHGKGLRSRHTPKLKILTRSLLRRIPGVLAYASARPEHGGTGAVYVLLARPG